MNCFNNLFHNVRLCKERKDKKECHVYLYNDDNEMQIFQGTFLQCISHTISVYTTFGFFQDRSKWTNSLMWPVESVPDLCGFGF